MVDRLHFISGLGNNDRFPIPRWRYHLAANWEAGAWSATLAQTFQVSYSEFDSTRCDECARRRVGSYQLWDAQLAYVASHGKLALSMKNLFDRKPPFTQNAPAWAVGYDAGYADPRGRSVYVTGTIKY